MSGIYRNDPQTYSSFPSPMSGLQVPLLSQTGWVSRSGESSPGIKLSSLCQEVLKVVCTLGLCNFVLNYMVSFCSLFSVCYTLVQGHISSLSIFSWLPWYPMLLCVSIVIVRDQLVQLVEYYCALIFPTYFTLVLTKLLPSFKNRGRNTGMFTLKRHAWMFMEI